MRLFHIWLSEEDRQKIELLRRKGAMRSAAETVRGCIRLAVSMYAEHKKDADVSGDTYSE